ncbi:MAG: hypothetical protein IT557_09940 [Alphaproteobacteria bacterium]|nr:hypothetical protein [Alphaproteobacteria bacterium]
MAQLASIAAVLTAASAVFSIQQQARQSSAARQAEAARQAQLNAQQQSEQQRRRELLAKTIAATRARLAAGGIDPNTGSASALQEGLRQEADRREQESAAIFSARLAAGRRSLLSEEGEIRPFLRAGTSFARLLDAPSRSLLDA